VAEGGDVESAEPRPRNSDTSKIPSKSTAKLPAPASEQIHTTSDFDARRSARPTDADLPANGPANSLPANGPANGLPANGPANGLAPAGRAPSGVWPFAVAKDLAAPAAPAMANG
jgi:hypothetical protein